MYANFALSTFGPYLPLIDGIGQILKQDEQFKALPEQSQLTVMGNVVQKAVELALSWEQPSR